MQVVKTTDIQNDLREFNSLFSLIAYRHEPSRVFDDFLTIVICCLARQTQEKLYHETIKNYNKEELNNFAKLLGSLMMYYDREISVGDWCDPLGDYYEAIAWKSKKKGFGQFFTPKAICSMMAQMTQKKNDFGKTINEPACGSGRLILASNHQAEGNKFIAQDLDHVCIKMCVINCAFHGIRCDAFHMDSLRITDPYNTYVVNHDYYKTETPCIFKISP
jgi:type I restriction enzyme M protein